jgi:predicted amidohydrolase YtcJ
LAAHGARLALEDDLAVDHHDVRAGGGEGATRLDGLVEGCGRQHDHIGSLADREPAAVRFSGRDRRIEHAQMIAPDDRPRFASAGIAASVQPVHLRTDAPGARRAWGERAEREAFAWSELVATEAVIAFGTDAPVEPFDPWPGIAVAVARRDPFSPRDEVTGAHHAIDLARALRAACLDPAVSAGQDDLGRLLPGYRADMLVGPAASLSDSADPTLLAGTRPLATLLDGQVVHRDLGFDS